MLVTGRSEHVCQIGIEGQRFVSLGLAIGQTELTPQQLAWFEQHGDRVVAACEGVQSAIAVSLPAYLAENRASIALLDGFCRDCKIVDS